MPIAYFGVRADDTGEWIAPMYRLRGGKTERRDGWKCALEYPFKDGRAPPDRSALTCS